MTTLRVVGLFISEDACKSVQEALGRVDSVLLTVKRVGAQERPLAPIGEEELPDVLIVEINGHRDRDIADVERVLATHGGQITVFVTYQTGDIETLRRLMRAGVKDVLPQPIHPQELVLELTNLLSQKRAGVLAAKGGYAGVTAFIDAKGEGATTLAVNVAHSLATEYSAKVCLVDLDLQFGDVALYLDLAPERTIMDALSQPERMDAVFLSALMTKHESGLDVLASPGHLTPVEGVSERAVTTVLETAVQIYDFVIVDVPRYLAPWSLAALRFADPLMLVMQNTLVAIRDAKMFLDYLPAQGVPETKVELVNNRAMSDLFSVKIDELKKTLHKEHIHRIRNDYAAAVSAYDRGVPLASVAPSSKLTKDIVGLAKYLVDRSGRPIERKSGRLSKWFHGKA